ncbi:hypothetical protein D6833_06615, partial [Candidatus Parcubacteria bacterium]
MHKKFREGITRIDKGKGEGKSRKFCQLGQVGSMAQIFQKERKSFMPKQAFALEPGGAKRLEVTWKRGFENVFVWFDGRVVGFIPDRRALSAGQEVRLPDS